ncbi:MAG: hypothetical protein LBF05_04935, partial [Tannerella sp.]|nr:hypothetical protein [Tannerella sp.]
MKAGYSRSFEKAVKKLSGKMQETVRNMIIEVKKAQNMNEITDCIRLSGYDYVYRIRIGNYRA